ncbi:MAG: alkaline shock response membrane anchor protein AmaP [Bacillota bacterium]
MRTFFTAIWVLMVATIAALLALVPVLGGVGAIITDFIEFIQDSYLFSVVFALVLGLSLWLFAAQFQGSKRNQAPSSVILHVEEGEVRVAMSAIETLVQQAAGQVKGIREVRSSFFTKDEGLGVYIRTTVTAEESIPELSSQLQKVVKDHVLRIAGINIEEVRVLVENVSTAARNRVELR